MDKDLFWQVEDAVNKEGVRIVSLSLQKHKVDSAIEQFRGIWDEAREIPNEIQEFCVRSINEDNQ